MRASSIAGAPVSVGATPWRPAPIRPRVAAAHDGPSRNSLHVVLSRRIFSRSDQVIDHDAAAAHRAEPRSLGGTGLRGNNVGQWLAESSHPQGSTCASHAFESGQARGSELRHSDLIHGRIVLSSMTMAPHAPQQHALRAASSTGASASRPGSLPVAEITPWPSRVSCRSSCSLASKPRCPRPGTLSATPWPRRCRRPRSPRAHRAARCHRARRRH